ncbi:sugar transferase [Pseudoalteromonas sp. SMS1]|uniref:sugar transferase n=1 Tax=Pseudoalteromonas sp. SMS1 TaxID=2908894 RepID=UPI001F3C83A7|nr:sugar transferase [Pseudoalteromonas sp. SMS1]MCF2857402.1 sugar transferase [Pseudoalteromonas sp. SMS1]
MKHIFDFSLSFLAILLLSPLLIATALLVKLTSRGPILFKQKRIGLHGEEFEIYKFRTMTDVKRDFNVQVTKATSDVTRLGRVIRRLKIDELPQLFNVLSGKMSIVGPRPCLPALVGEFNEDGRSRLTVRPGLTGLAQVNGNIHLTWEERWKYDRFYAENHSFFMDIKIIVRTILIVLLGEKWGKSK